MVEKAITKNISRYGVRNLLFYSGHKRNKSSETSIGYATNFGATLSETDYRGVEEIVMTYVFKALITRLVDSYKELASPDNMVSYGEDRPWSFKSNFLWFLCQRARFPDLGSLLRRTTTDDLCQRCSWWHFSASCT